MTTSMSVNYQHGNEHSTMVSGSIRFAEGNRLIYIGDCQTLNSLALSPTLWRVLYFFVTIFSPIFIIFLFDPTVFETPIVLLGTLVAVNCFALVLLAARSVIALTISSTDTELAVFDLEQASIDIVFRGSIGLTRIQFEFADVERIRLGRGEWDGEMVKSLLVLDLNSGESIVIGSNISGTDLTMLRVMSGIRAT